MFFLTRLSRRTLVQKPVTKLIHTTAYLRNSASSSSAIEPPSNKNLIHSTNAISVGRHRSTKPKRNKSLTTLPESFLATNFFRRDQLEPIKSKNQYENFIPDYVWQELEYSVRSGLAPKGVMASFNHTDHLAINVPDKGTCYFQDYIVKQLAISVKTDLLVLDPQDFIFLAQHSFNRDAAATLLPMLSSIDPDSNALLALRPTNPSEEDNVDRQHDDASRDDRIGRGGSSVEVFKKEDQEDDNHTSARILEEEDDNEEDEDIEDDKLKININNTKAVEIDIDDIYDQFEKGSDKDIQKVSKTVLNQISFKYTSMFKRLLMDGVVDKKDDAKIIYLRDYEGMQDAFTRIMLKSLVVAVEDLKQKGHRLVIIASHCPYYNKESEYYVPMISNMRQISILPPLDSEALLGEWKQMMKQDEKKRIGEINAKQMLALYSQKSVLDTDATTFFKDQRDLLKDLLDTLGDDISKTMWSPIEVDRRVTAAIGHAIKQNKTSLDVNDFRAANNVVQQAMELRGKSLKKLHLAHRNNLKMELDGSLDMDYLKRTCNEYERKLLPRVVDPARVQGSFKDVRAPPTTVDTLQSLISLPLIRPDLFKKGILKKNFIPGVLLFGPPGTGKTMLAKAVAKESGSRMLDIQASDVYDMYVGQGEKNVKAIFSLARKLSPCVIFIDEVDSLMSKRGSDYSSKSHREIINQFMVEWDGLSSNNQGVIVMAATNRPFDLDDAVLRRMPRRLLVDLPNEEDRAEILKILLQDEDNHHNISYKEIAKLTEHYSGSDLKNVCVTAALGVVQQQMKSTATKPEEKPQLNIDHIKEAIKMVPPSSSEEMDSLIEIRKWDAKFGNDKKKKSLIGFA